MLLQLKYGILLLFVTTGAYAASLVKIDIVAEKKVVFVKNGQKVTKIVPATEIKPGEEIIFTIHYRNEGDDAAVGVAIDNPVPENSEYIPFSASGKHSDILFSIDGGKNYKQPSLLTYEVSLSNGKKEKRRASPEQYTDIRWVVNRIEPKAKGSVRFKIKVK